jgi:hypothetical protein
MKINSNSHISLNKGYGNRKIKDVVTINFLALHTDAILNCEEQSVSHTASMITIAITGCPGGFWPSM